MLKSGAIYLKSIDKNHRRFYEKFHKDKSTVDSNKDMQELYVSYKYLCSSLTLCFMFVNCRLNIFKIIKSMAFYIS